MITYQDWIKVKLCQKRTLLNYPTRLFSLLTNTALYVYIVVIRSFDATMMITLYINTYTYTFIWESLPITEVMWNICLCTWWGESTGDRWIPIIKYQQWGAFVFFVVSLNMMFNQQPNCWCFVAPWCHLMASPRNVQVSINEEAYLTRIGQSWSQEVTRRHVSKVSQLQESGFESFDCICRNATSQIAKFTGPTGGPLGSGRPQMGPMLALWTLLSGLSASQFQISPKIFIHTLAASRLCWVLG